MSALAELPEAIGREVAEHMPTWYLKERITERELAVGKPPEAMENRLGNGLGNDFPDFPGDFPAQERVIEPIAAPSKMTLAIMWLREHPEDAVLTGRELESLRQPQGVNISYRTWNDAKKQL